MELRRIVSFAALLGCALLLAACDKATYEVGGTGTATITYRDGESKTEKNVSLPWKKEVTGISKLELKAVGSGQLDCSITTKKGVKGHTNDNGCSVESQE